MNLKQSFLSTPVIENFREKLKKIAFESRNEITHTVNEIAEFVNTQLPPQSAEFKINCNNNRRKANKHQVTAYLLDEELALLDQLHLHKRKAKIKTDRSTIIGEAIKTLARLSLEKDDSEQRC